MFVRTILVIVFITVFAAIGYAQGTTVARDADEAEAWNLYKQYVQSRRAEAPLEAAIKQKFGDSLMGAHGYMAIFGTDQEAAAEVKAKKARLDAERKLQADLIAAWDKKFYWRYGDLRWSDDKIRDAKTGRDMDRVEFALTYFPFNYKPGKIESANSAPRGTFEAVKGKPGDWAQVRVTLGSVTGFTTEDRPGWRNNGTGFKASSAGNSRVSVNIEIIGKGGVSYFDYKTSVSVKTSSGKVLIAEGPVISKDGGSVSFSTAWTPSADDSGLNVNVSVTGGNPETFTNFVSGRVDMAAAQGGQISVPTQTQRSIAVPTGEPKTLFTSGNDYGVGNGGTPPSFAVSSPVVITQISSYHWNGGRGAPGGTITIKNAAGKVMGTWNVTVRAKVYWEVNEPIKLPPGTYTIIDSDPSTWAQNAQSGGKGMVIIKGFSN